MAGGIPNSICIIDDDADFAQFLSHYMQSKGAQCTVFSCAEAFLESKSIGSFQAYIIDLGLPGLDGVDLTALIRARTDAGILVISGRMGPDAFNSALAAGADMFINKPVRFDQVYNALASIWRRAPSRSKAAIAWAINAEGSSLSTPSGEVVSLSQLEARLIRGLIQANGEPVSRAALVEYTQMQGGPDHRNLDAAVFRLRRKIEKETGQPSPFKTVHGIGYQLAAPVEDEDRSSAR